MHRRGGKDKTAWNVTVKKAFERVGTYFYFLPTYTQAKKVIWDGVDKDGVRFLDHIPKELIKNKNETEMKIELVNGSIIQLVGADNIDRIVGTNPIGVVFSEYAIMKPQVWDYIRPILAENGGWAIFIYTPRGMNHGWKLYQQAVSSPDWFCSVDSVTKTQAIPYETLMKEKAEMPQDLYQQEYECIFLESASQFFKRVEDNVYEGGEDYDPSHVYKLGVDLAKYQDFTVITPFDLNTFKVGKQDRFNQIDWNLQKARIRASYFLYKNPRLTMDATGIGDPIYDDLVQQGVQIEPYKFNERSRKDLLMNLKLLIEQDKIKIPNDEILLNELKSFQYEMSETGKTRLVVPDGLHDDCVMSLALAVWDIPDRPLRIHTNNGFDQAYDPYSVL